MLGLGLSLTSRAVLGSASGSTDIPAAPVLTWTSGVTDTTPNFSVNLPSGLGAPSDAVSGDVIYLEIADNISFTTTSTDTLDAGDVTGDIVAMEQATPLADGTYYARARLKRGSSYGAYSNTETKTIDATAPTITSSNSVSLAENSALSHSLTANETVTWTKTGGADTALFTLAGSNLSMTAKDFETPADANTNNTYVVQVTATDAAGNATNQTITVTVTDVVEGSPPVPTYQTRAATSTSTQIQPAASLAIGTASATRLVIVAVTGVGIASSAKITPSGGSDIAMTLAVSQATTPVRASIWYAIVPTATTATFEITYTSNPFTSSNVSVWTVDSANMSSTTPVDTDSAVSAAAATLTLNLSTSTGGFVISVAASSNISTNSATWSGVTERFDTTAVGQTTTGGDSSGTPSGTNNYAVTPTYANSGGIGLAAVSWR